MPHACQCMAALLLSSIFQVAAAAARCGVAAAMLAMLLLSLPHVSCVAIDEPPQSTHAPAAAGTATFVIAVMTDLVPGGATSVTTAGCPPGSVSLRSGGHHSTATATVAATLSPGITVTSVSFAYRYTTGYSGPVGANFSLLVGGASVYASPLLTMYPYTKTGNYSPAQPVAARNLAIKVARGAERLLFRFQNNDRNLQLLLPMTITVACSGGLNGSCTPPTPPKPTQVFAGGENVSGFNPTGDSRAYQCFRIPQLLALPSGKVLAFAEGRADGCKPDVHTGRPIVVRSSGDGGKTWGPIGIAGPALAHSGTNYPGAFVRDSKTVALRYETGHGVLETTSTSEGATWSSPTNASQPAGNTTCGSMWPKMIGSAVVMPCGAGTAKSTDGGKTWLLSTGTVSNRKSVGEAMVAPDGRTAKSLTMMIRGGEPPYNHAVARSEDLGDTWSNASTLPLVGTTNEGSVGRDVRAPAGKVFLGATYGRNGFYLGRGNMTVFALDTTAAVPKAVAVQNMWAYAAGYSDFAQAWRDGKPGPLLMLFEAGITHYDQGIKLAVVAS
jgi:hypothetical protein